MRIDLITIFPNYFDCLNISLLKKAQSNQIIEINTINLRDFSTDPHSSVDDTPYGGGAGMVMKADIIIDAVESVITDDSLVIFTSASGETFNQQFAQKFASSAKHLIFVCTRFEGYDIRAVQYLKERYPNNHIIEMSIGNYVLFGGEVAAIVMIEAIARLIPGVLGNPKSLDEESHSMLIDGEIAKEYPQYTKPSVVRGLGVPEVLLNGNHQLIKEWREKHAR